MLVENDGVLIEEKNDLNSWSRVKQVIDYTPAISPSSTPFETIQALLIQGNTLGACDYAQATNLWSHALIIAAFIDSETYANTLNAFLQYEFTSGVKYQANQVQEQEELIPLQVIYTMFSNGSNDSCTYKNLTFSVADFKWGKQMGLEDCIINCFGQSNCK